MSSLLISLLILYARKSSRNFRVRVRSEFRYRILMYCCVIVEPPCTSPPRAIIHAARTMPRIEMPWSVQNVRFSAATAACFMVSGILLEGERGAVLDGKAAELTLAVVVIDVGGCGLEVGVRSWKLCRGVAVDDDRDRADHAEEGQPADGDEGAPKPSSARRGSLCGAHARPGADLRRVPSGDQP